MKLTLSLFLGILFTQISLAADNAPTQCDCVGLAGNFPGYTLVCDNEVKNRFPFGNDENAALAQCEQAKVQTLGSALVSSSNCECEVFPGNFMGVVLFHKSEWGKSGLKSFELAQNQLSATDIKSRLASCRGLMRQLLDIGVCKP